MGKLVLKLVLASLLFSSCNYTNKEEAAILVPEPSVEPVIVAHAKDSLDWKGVYEGVLPCTDCAGIETRIQIMEDLTYTVDQKFLEDGGVLASHGSFEWDEEGIVIHLKDVNKMEFLFRVEENQIRMLNSKGKAVQGENAEAYVLKKEREVN